MSSLAEIVAEGKRQLANYQTMILPHGDAARLLAVAEAAVEMREVLRRMNYGCDKPDLCPCAASAALRAFDAAAGGQP